MKQSPSFSNGFVSPPRSPRSSVRSLGMVVHAAASTALLCIVLFSHQPTGNESLLGLQPRAKGNVFRMETNLDASSMKSLRFTRRSIRLDAQPSSSKVDTAGERSESSSRPNGVIWLMSFPNSGTSYTLHAVRELSNSTTASNYGLEGDIKDEPSIPAFDTSDTGPFLELIPNRSTNVPQLILTKTHCGGFSTSLNPASYVETPRSFLKSCLKAMRGIYSSDSSSMVTQTGWYSQSLVKKVLHIIRNPLDNIVARFHLERKRLKNDTKWLHEYPNNKVGFRKWCQVIDDAKELIKTRWVDRDLAEAFSGVPCHAEFYKYVEWHNNAFIVTQEYPTMVFHYEEYSTRFDDITKDLTEFLELERNGVAPPFIANKNYGDYYSKEQTRAIAGLVKELSSRQTWEQLAHYFDSIESEKVIAVA